MVFKLPLPRLRRGESTWSDASRLKRTMPVAALLNVLPQMGPSGPKIFQESHFDP